MFGAGTEYTYYDEYYYETDSYSFGSFDATNQYSSVSAEVGMEETTVSVPAEPEPVVEVVEEPVEEVVAEAVEEVAVVDPFDYGLDYYDEEYF